MSRIIASITNYSAAALLLLFGITYSFKKSFMFYHSEALSMSWDQVPDHTAILILGLMRAVGGGFVASAVAMAFLQYQFEKTKASWIPGLILLIGSIVSAGSIYATVLVRMQTPGQPPTIMAFVGELLLVTGFVFNLLVVRLHKRRKSASE